MREREPRQEQVSIWSIDESLAHLPLSAWGETTSYSARIKARVDRAQYHQRTELYPLSTECGTKLDLTARAYILVPVITLTADIDRHELPAGALGNVTSSQWEGMQHREIARLRSFYYKEENVLAVWEVDDAGRLDLLSRVILWQGFEQFLLGHYPDTTHIYADDAEPGDNQADNGAFLESLGYTQLPKRLHIFRKDRPAIHP